MADSGSTDCSAQHSQYFRNSSNAWPGHDISHGHWPSFPSKLSLCFSKTCPVCGHDCLAPLFCWLPCPFSPGITLIHLHIKPRVANPLLHVGKVHKNSVLWILQCTRCSRSPTLCSCQNAKRSGAWQYNWNRGSLSDASSLH
jgi:hypothetical protein